jgi:Carboxypeptidase regulatory-like domain
MYRVLGLVIVLFVGLSCHAQVQIPVGNSRSSDNNNPKSSRITSRTLAGTVIDKGDKPIPNAVVYLKNTKTLAVKTVFAQNDGSYRFPELSPNVDYDVYAMKDGKKSSTKTLSQFDSREKANLNLQIDINK